jgi:hypothetical protein
MARAKKHVHKYHYTDLKYAKVWSCALPDCYHYMPDHMSVNVIGKRSLCWECNGEFILDENNMKNEMPICYECAHANVIAHLTNKV